MSISINLPGSKSITNRALILAALSDKNVEIKNAAICDDTKYMIQGLKCLGLQIKQNKTTIKIKGTNGNFKKFNKPIKIFTGNAGTTTRFLTALSTLTGNQIIIDGNKRMKNRPIEELVQSLNKLGADVKSKNGNPPLIISNKKLQGGKISINGNISSQYLSAILMTAPFAEKNTAINVEQNLCSTPYIDMTISMAKKFGISIVNKQYRQFLITAKKENYHTENKGVRERSSLTSKGGVPSKRDRESTKGRFVPSRQPFGPLEEIIYLVESDASSASYFGALACINPQQSIILKNLPKHSLQGDIKFLDYIKKMGCKLTENALTIKIKGPKILKSLGIIDMNKTPDLVMTFAVLAMFSNGKTKITNIENLRIKETDRIKALENEIKKFGIKITTGKNYIEIEGNPKKIEELKKLEKSLKIKTYNDHRIAMSFGILKTILPNLKIENPSCVNKSFPGFWEKLNKQLNK